MQRYLLLLAGLVLLAAPTSHGAANEPNGDPLAEWLKLSGWTEERLTAAAAESPLSQATEKALLDLAERFRRLPDRLLEASVISVSEDNESMSPGQVVEIAGQGGAARRLEGAAGFEVRATTPGAATPITILTPAAPAAWSRGGVAELNEPLRLRGIVVAWDADRRLVVAPRVEWRPASAASELVSLGAALLGQAGMDVGLLDDLADGKPLTAADAEPFYTALAAGKRYRPGQLLRVAGENLPAYAARWQEEKANNGPRRRLAAAVLARARDDQYSVAPLFNDAAAQRGELVAFEGTARRAVRIDLSLRKDGRPSAIPERHGVDHYYEVEVFPQDSQNLPLVFCVLELPEGFPTGDAVREPVRLAGFFLKRWAYRTRKPSAAAPGADRRQLAPLLVGPGLVWLPGATGDDDEQGQLLAGAAFVGVLAIVAAALWRQSRGDRRFERTVLARYTADGNHPAGPDPAATDD